MRLNQLQGNYVCLLWQVANFIFIFHFINCDVTFIKNTTWHDMNNSDSWWIASHIMKQIYIYTQQGERDLCVKEKDRESEHWWIKTTNSKKQQPFDQRNGWLKYLAQSESHPEFVKRKWTLVTGMEMKVWSNRKIIMDQQDSSAIRDLSHIT